MVALFRLGHELLVVGELGLGAEGGTADAGQHGVVAVGLPVGTGDGAQLERLERLGVGEVRADAHVDVLALLVESDARVFGQIGDVLDLVLLAAFLHELDGLLARELEGLDLEVLLADLLHLGFDGREVFHRQPSASPRSMS